MELHAQHSRISTYQPIPPGLSGLVDDRPATISIGVRNAVPSPLPTVPAPLSDFPLDELEVRLAESVQDMAQVKALRNEIDLAAAMAADPLFLDREKKETN